MSWCRADALAFPVRDGIPVMLESEARKVEPAELDAERSPAADA